MIPLYFLVFAFNSFAATSYEVYSIPFDVDFYNGTGPNDVEKRSWGKKILKSVNVDKMMSQSASKCNKPLPPIIDYRIKITGPSSNRIFIDRQRRITNSKFSCDFEVSLKNSVLKELGVAFKDINSKSGSEMIKDKESKIKNRPITIDSVEGTWN